MGMPIFGNRWLRSASLVLLGVILGAGGIYGLTANLPRSVEGEPPGTQTAADERITIPELPAAVPPFPVSDAPLLKALIDKTGWQGLTEPGYGIPLRQYGGGTGREGTCVYGSYLYDEVEERANKQWKYYYSGLYSGLKAENKIYYTRIFLSCGPTPFELTREGTCVLDLTEEENYQLRSPRVIYFPKSPNQEWKENNKGIYYLYYNVAAGPPTEWPLTGPSPVEWKGIYLATSQTGTGAFTRRGRVISPNDFVTELGCYEDMPTMQSVVFNPYTNKIQLFFTASAPDWFAIATADSEDGVKFSNFRKVFEFPTTSPLYFPGNLQNPVYDGSLWYLPISTPYWSQGETNACFLVSKDLENWQFFQAFNLRRYYCGDPLFVYTPEFVLMGIGATSSTPSYLFVKVLPSGKVSFPIIVKDALSGGAKTEPGDCIAIKAGEKVSLTTKVTYPANATAGLKLYVYSSPDNIDWDTEAIETKTLAFTAGATRQETFSLGASSLGARLLKCIVENTDPSVSATDIKITVTLEGF